MEYHRSIFSNEEHILKPDEAPDALARLPASAGLMAGWLRCGETAYAADLRRGSRFAEIARF
jgi:hypothetical protein